MFNILLVIAIALILGLLVTRLMKLIGLPNVTGYLIVGLIIGPHALGQFLPGAVDSFEALKIVSTVALGFIGFSIGVEFKISHVKEIGKSAIAITFCQALAATICVDLVLILVSLFLPSLGMSTSEAIILGAIATATAPAATLMVVRQYKAKGVVTGTLLPVVALDDAVGLIVFAISNSIALSMINTTETLTFVTGLLNFLVWPLVEIICSLAIGAFIGWLLSLIPRFFKSRDNRLIASIVAVFLSLGICELFGVMKDKGWIPFGLSDLLVCMMAGAAFINLRREAGQIMEGVDHWTPVVLMLFFILSGAELDVMMFAEGWGLVVCLLLYVIFRCVGKYFGTMLGATIVKSDKNVKKYLGITLFPQAGVAIGMATMCKSEFAKAAEKALASGNAELATTLGNVGANILTITMCAVLIYELIGPVLTKWALTRAGEIDPANLGKRRKKAVASAGDVGGEVADQQATSVAEIAQPADTNVEATSETPEKK